nr:MAG TPA: MqsA [Caudoviricetes sp.]
MSNLKQMESLEERVGNIKFENSKMIGEKNMRDKYSKSNINNVSGNVFNGPTNIIAGNNYFQKDEENKVASYISEPVWRSPITMGILTWIGFILALIDFFPMYKIVEPVINLITNKSIKVDSNNIIYGIVFLVIMLFLVLIVWLRSITKKETRHPLFFNYAISGLGRKITIEKIHIDKCPICGGTMKYFNKTVEWRDTTNSDGKTKREVTKKVPALQCERNSNHWYEVDPAVDKLK